ncbi:MAG: DUF3417 domain-containing protein [Deltaproteobacteria bacterium]|nr:DUF3417 domain-containing protein [Deltaproteobacteria bacterium]
MNPVKLLFPHLPERLAGLEELAENLWWNWNPGARMLFKTLEGGLWYLIRMQDEKIIWNRSPAGQCKNMAFCPISQRTPLENWRRWRK